MSYSVCKHGNKMCDGCMRCYDEEHEEVLDYEDEEELEEEEDEDDQ